MKKGFYILGLVLFLASCSTYKKVQVIKDALSKADSTNVELVSKKPKVDSAAIIKGILNKIDLAKIP
jgi:PBP1b-binding outer membrane lipoprotein LpoB